MSASDHLNGDQFMYHVSHDRNRESIATDGLSLRNSNDGKHIWLHPTLTAAQEHAASEQGNHYANGDPVHLDVYRANVQGYRTSKDPHTLAAGMGGRVVKKDIPPDRIERLS